MKFKIIIQNDYINFFGFSDRCADHDESFGRSMHFFFTGEPGKANYTGRTRIRPV